MLEVVRPEAQMVADEITAAQKAIEEASAYFRGITIIEYLENYGVNLGDWIAALTGYKDFIEGGAEYVKFRKDSWLIAYYLHELLDDLLTPPSNPE